MDLGEELYETARQYLPGGVCASVRLNRAIGHPFYVSYGDGSKIYDLAGREYIDLSMSHGASLLGHNHPQIKAAVQKALDMGVLCSYETEYHSALAKKIVEMVPCAEMVRFAGSGTETIMHALRLARAYTGHEKIIKFEGHFHGYLDYLYYSTAPPLDQAGPGNAPVPYPESAGMPIGMRDYIIVLPFNDMGALERAIASHKDEVAAIIMEPINYDAGCIVPQPNYIRRIRELCTENNIVLFYDEVLTAFRMGPGGAQEYLGVIPDLCVLGKAMGGGMPISAFCGKREIMEQVRPLGDCQHSGTYMAHLTTVLASLAALQEYSAPGFYTRLNTLGQQFYAGFDAIIRRSGVRARIQYVGPRFGLFFGVDPDEEVSNYRQAAKHRKDMMLKFVAECIKHGVYFHVSPHHGFSSAHTEANIDQALEAIEKAMLGVKQAFPDAK
jgi:glutamate-1-semialdehyde 2,1-aminomutase